MSSGPDRPALAGLAGQRLALQRPHGAGTDLQAPMRASGAPAAW